MSFKCYFQVHLLIKCDRSNWWLNYSTSFHLKVVYFLLLSIPLSLIQQNLVPWVGLEPWAAHMIRALEDFLSLYGVFISKEFPHWFKNYKTGELSPASMNPASSQHSRSASWGPQKATSPCPTCPRRSPFQTNQTSAWRKSDFRSVLIILSLVNTISARFFTSNTSLHCDTKKPYHICIVTWLT